MREKIEEDRAVVPAGSTNEFRGFRPHDRLRTSDDFLRVKKAGRRAGGPHFGATHTPNGLGVHRLGLVVQKRFWSGAVVRNRIKRCIREWFRLSRLQIPAPYRDIVVVARRGAESLGNGEASAELTALFTKQDTRHR